MKKLIITSLTVLAFAMTFTGCGGGTADEEMTTASSTSNDQTANSASSTSSDATTNTGSTSNDQTTSSTSPATSTPSSNDAGGVSSSFGAPPAMPAF